MRRILLVLLVLVSSVLLIQAPAYARHNYYHIRLEGKGSATFIVTTDCPANSTFELRSAAFNLGPAAERGSETRTVPNTRRINKSIRDSNGQRIDIRVRQFELTTEKVSSRAGGYATFTATCNGHPLRATEDYPEAGEDPDLRQTVSLELPMTGVPVLPLLALGLGLVLAGGVLMALGRARGPRAGRS